MAQYLEIYSKHRDRQCDPSPSHFSIPFGKSQSSDPVLNGTIVYQWSGLSGSPGHPFTIVNAGYFKTGTKPSAPLLDLYPIYPSTEFIPISSQGNTQPTYSNFYNGYSIINLRTAEIRIIIGYDPSNVSVTLNAAFSDCIPGDPYYINTNSYSNAVQPPYIDTNGNLLSQTENAYAGYYLVDETLSASLSSVIYQQISYYNATLRYFYLNNPFSNAEWSPSDSYSLRQSLPSEIWNLTQYTYINTNPSYGPRGPVIILPGGSLQNDFYKGKYIYYSSNANSPISPLLSVSSSSSSTSSTPTNPYYGAFLITSYKVTYDSHTHTYLREAFVQQDINKTRLPYTLITSGFTFGPGTVPQAPKLSTSDPYYNIDGYYVGYQVTNLSTGEQQLITSQVDGVITLQNTKSINAIGLILTGSTPTSVNFFYGNSDGTLLIGSVSPGQTFYHLLSNGTSETSLILTFNLDLVTSIATITLQTPLTYQVDKVSLVGDQFQISTTSSGDPYIITTPSQIDIVNFLSDNVVPLNYIGTMTSVQTSVCYTMTLESLTLPNVTLVTGSQIAFYPYVYVEIKNVSASESASSDIIYSNNPPSGRARFIVPITDVINPLTGLFVKLKGSHNQIIKFKPNDNFYFSVTLPNGQYFQPIESDTLSPYLPNSLLQIHAMFSIKRI